ncbi:MAG TPA: helix-turn-helix transcriptional regulator [Ktedonobacteraceae bacterium]|nr:helix-turn-helix transcriptional regulator [Ktedonobacteraceae bacterium]
MAFRLRLKEVLKEKGITMGKLSRGADIPISTVRRLVNDPKYNPTAATLAKAAQYLGVLMDDLWYDDEKESSNS